MSDDREFYVPYPPEIEVPVGVVRYSMSFNGEPEITGNLDTPSREMDLVLSGQAIAKPIIAYLVSETRLRSLLAYARNGVDIDDLLLSVDAAALGVHHCSDCGDENGG